MDVYFKSAFMEHKTKLQCYLKKNFTASAFNITMLKNMRKMHVCLNVLKKLTNYQFSEPTVRIRTTVLQK